MKSKQRLDVTIVGLGYVGLSTSVCLASRGFRVKGIDIDADRVKKISSGLPVIHEAMLKDMLEKGIKSENLLFGAEFDEEAADSRFIFITVGTPSKPDGTMETIYLETAAKQIGMALGKKRFFQTVIVKSTVLPGTTSSMIKPMLERLSGRKVGKGIGLCVNPEFLREGSAINDTFNPDALIIGREDRKSEIEILQLYKKFYSRLPRTIITSFTNAEMIKYAVNSFRGVQLSFLNSLANLANNLENSDVGEVINGLASITKVDGRYLRPGPGFGGSCLPKDMKALLSLMKEKKVDPTLLEAALTINNKQPRMVADIASKELNGLKGKRVCLLGLAYKGGTDDVRDSPSLLIAEELLSKGARVVAYDPAAIERTKEIFNDKIEYSDNLIASLIRADVAIIATDWAEFRELRPSTFLRHMKKPIVIDARRILDRNAFKNKDIRLITLGTSVEGWESAKTS